ncbi:aminodeoxychorismate synthase component I [Streptococcus gallolyticus subsp. gallolyticus]|uniref:aminodeoxychorismate synthase component I n=1 Tax=Streptococcus gallolyticus TaxID=315405 RepID=UPI00228330E3|nr:aminodeoxychorismate synthase component I [Streptococcus gallolyticus]MCY7171988.1 aminodeoxychorismate synthase component I [Streptococcus gallolyticus subsp. gallolyticus]
MHKKTVVDFKELGHRLIFENPVKILATKLIDDVEAILKKVVYYQSQGYYVVGYVSYEAGKAFENNFSVKTFPLSGEYLVYFTVHSEVKKEPFPLDYEMNITMPQVWESKTDKDEYEKAISEIRQQIRQGNTYQVNYTVQLHNRINSDLFELYNRLVIEQDAKYNCYIEHDDFAVLSMSPELFFEKNGSKLTTRPMKGTVARGINDAQDFRNKHWLANDSKNRSENMMIVDLLRNDMGRISELGSVTVSKLCDIEQYSTVWQMTSTIESQLKKALSLFDIFNALFPCGSITGAPKISTMSIINQLEPSPRGVYCGSIGICLPHDDRAIFNVAIRTIQVKDDQAIYGVGGGITWDSEWESEYRETCEKSAFLYKSQPTFNVLTTAKITQKKVIFLKEHTKRLKSSARFFGWPFSETEFLDKISELLKTLDLSDYRLRVLLHKSGQLSFEVSMLEDLPSTFLQAKLVQREETCDSPFTYFKTSYRLHIPNSDKEQVFISSDGYLQETSIGNIILEIDGAYYTPPVEVGILDGIYRKYLIQQGEVTERYLTKTDLENADHIYVCNSVRGLYEISVI